VSEKEAELNRMMFTGTLINDLMATVERVEAAQLEDTLVPDSVVHDAWFASIQEHADYDLKLIAVA
jgi:hypothetical protein